MDQKKIATVQKDLFSRLQTELPEGITYHDVAHTRDEVIPAAQLLCSRAGLAEEEQQLVLTAALLHDIGYLQQHSDNEKVGAAMAAEILAAVACPPREIEIITRLIMETKMPQQPSSRLSEMLCDADLATLGQGNFYRESLLLRQELCFFGRKISREQWHREQYNFLEKHRYFTPEARSLWDAGKRTNMAMLAQLLRDEHAS